MKRDRQKGLAQDRKGAVYVETLVAFLPVFMFFLGTLQVADLSVAHLVVEHASSTAARAAVVVLPDDGIYYEDHENAQLHQYSGLRRSDIELAAGLVLEAVPRLSLRSVDLDKQSYAPREDLTATVKASYRCLIAPLCGSGLDLQSQSKLVYQGANFIYEPTTVGEVVAHRPWNRPPNQDPNAPPQQGGNTPPGPTPGGDPNAPPGSSPNSPNPPGTNPDDPSSDPWPPGAAPNGPNAPNQPGTIPNAPTRPGTSPNDPNGSDPSGSSPGRPGSAPNPNPPGAPQNGPSTNPGTPNGPIAGTPPHGPITTPGRPSPNDPIFPPGGSRPPSGSIPPSDGFKPGQGQTPGAAPNGPIASGPTPNDPQPRGATPNEPPPNGPNRPNRPIANGPIANGPIANVPGPSGPTTNGPTPNGPWTPSAPTLNGSTPSAGGPSTSPVTANNGPIASNQPSSPGSRPGANPNGSWPHGPLAYPGLAPSSPTAGSAQGDGPMGPSSQPIGTTPPDRPTAPVDLSKPDSQNGALASASPAPRAVDPNNPNNGQVWVDEQGRTRLPLVGQRQCFAAGTLVYTADGDRPIETIRQGDLVWSRSDATGELALRRVAKLFVTEDQSVFDVPLVGRGQRETVTVTVGHPFWVDGRGWTHSQALKRGDLLWSPEGRLQSEALQPRSERVTVYNFEVEDFHSYFVGSLHAWVHNQSECPIPGLSPAQQQQVNEFFRDRRNRDLSPTSPESSTNPPPDLGQRIDTARGRADLASSHGGSGFTYAVGGTGLRNGWSNQDLTAINLLYTQTLLQEDHPGGVNDPRSQAGDLVQNQGQANQNHPIVIGGAAASHSEQIVAIADGLSGQNEPIGVSREQCGVCRNWFREHAMAQQQTFVVADPMFTRVYFPNGEVSVYDSKGNLLVTVNEESNVGLSKYAGVPWSRAPKPPAKKKPSSKKKNKKK